MDDILHDLLGCGRGSQPGYEYTPATLSEDGSVTFQLGALVLRAHEHSDCARGARYRIDGVGVESARPVARVCIDFIEGPHPVAGFDFYGYSFREVGTDRVWLTIGYDETHALYRVFDVKVYDHRPRACAHTASDF
jgi:hypothetical protein